MGRSRQSSKRVGEDRQDSGHIPLLGSMGGVLWVSQARARFAHSNQKNKILVNLTRVLPKRCVKKKTFRRRKARETADHKCCWGSLIRSLFFSVIQGFYLGHILP